MLTLTTMGCRKLYELNQPKDKEIEYSVVKHLAGEWWVVYRFDDGTGKIGDWYGVGYTELITCNTSRNTADSLWVMDLGNFWDYSVKATATPDNHAFSGKDVINTKVTDKNKCQITNGKVIMDGATSPYGVKTDSIYFEIQFEDDDDKHVFQCSGYRKTGFIEDDH